MMQAINQITLLTVILTGAALIREREQGTGGAPVVMPVVPAESCWRKRWRPAS